MALNEKFVIASLPGSRRILTCSSGELTFTDAASNAGDWAWHVITTAIIRRNFILDY
jgi:hypothetical protein